MDNRPIMRTGGVALLLLLSLALAGIVDGQSPPPALSTSYYSNSCPTVVSIVDKVVLQAIKKSRNIVGGLLRLHFHDCFIRGCDASVLIDSTLGHLAEKDGPGNANSLRGFEVIDNVKLALENACPGIVSCADILALVANSAVSQIGGPSWITPLGRRDGNTSNASETSTNLPSLDATYLQLQSTFASKGLSETDMVALSGAHTIGNTHCHIIEPRLYNSSGAGGVDPALDATYAAQLRAACPFSNGQSMTVVPMDPTLGNDTFDSNYYSNVKTKKGLFTSDAALVTNPTGLKLVLRESSGAQIPYFSDFANAMTNMAGVQVLLAPQGEIRKNCHVVNSAFTTLPAVTPASAPTPVPSTAAVPIPSPPPVSSPAPIATPPSAPAPASPALVPVATSPAPAPPVPTSPATAPAPPVPTSPATAPVPASLAPTPITAPLAPTPITAPLPPSPVPSAPTPTPLPHVSKSPSPAGKSSSSSSSKSPAPAAEAPKKSSSSRSRSPSPIYYIAVLAAGVFTRTVLRW